MKKYYVAVGSEPKGPFTLEELLQNNVTPTTLVWYEGIPEWAPAESIEEIRAALAAKNTPAPQAATEIIQEAAPMTQPMYTPQPMQQYAPQQPYQQYPPMDPNAPGYGQQEAEEPYEEPKTWLTEAILCTIFCCMPFGIPAIVHAAQVGRLYAEGRYQDAEDASYDAKKWVRRAFIWGLIANILVVIYYIWVFSMANSYSSSYYYY